MNKHPYHLQAGDKIDGFTVESFRDSKIRNSRTGDFDIAIEFEGQDFVMIVPRHEILEVN